MEDKKTLKQASFGDMKIDPRAFCVTTKPYTPTRREYFAAKAMQAVLSNPKLTSGIREQDIWPCCELTAKFAVKMTDAIIKELDKEIAP